MSGQCGNATQLRCSMNGPLGWIGSSTLHEHSANDCVPGLHSTICSFTQIGRNVSAMAVERVFFFANMYTSYTLLVSFHISRIDGTAKFIYFLFYLFITFGGKPGKSQ